MVSLRLTYIVQVAKAVANGEVTLDNVAEKVEAMNQSFADAIAGL